PATRNRDGERGLPELLDPLDRNRLADLEPDVPEAAHLLDDRQERLALLGQLVLDARRRLGVAATGDDVLVLQRAQPVRERPRADSRTGVLELGEAARPLREVVDKHRGPLRAEDLRTGRDRAAARVVDLAHRAHAPNRSTLGSPCRSSTSRSSTSRSSTRSSASESTSRSPRRRNAKLVVLLGSLLHCVGMAVHRDRHEDWSLFLAEPKARELLAGIYEEPELTVVVSEVLETITSHRESGHPLTLEAGIVRVADALD